MSSFFSVDATGRIRKLWTCQEDVAAINAEGFDYQEGVPPHDATHYVNGVFSKTVTTEALCIDALMRRGRLLVESDWTQLPDVPLATKAAWATYRQALRDITEQPGYPINIVWPTQP